MDKVEKIDLNNKIHYAIAYKAVEINKDLFIDDSVNSIAEYLNEVKYWLNNGSLGFFYYIDNKLYAVIYVEFDRNKNATLNFTLFEQANFFKTSKVIKFLIKYLFEKCNANKIKANIYPFEHIAELIYRYCGLKKEGISRDEIILKGKKMSLVNLAITENDYKNLKPVNRDYLKNIIRKLKHV